MDGRRCPAGAGDRRHHVRKKARRSPAPLFSILLLLPRYSSGIASVLEIFVDICIIYVKTFFSAFLVLYFITIATKKQFAEILLFDTQKRSYAKFLLVRNNNSQQIPSTPIESHRIPSNPINSQQLPTTPYKSLQILTNSLQIPTNPYKFPANPYKLLHF